MLRELWMSAQADEVVDKLLRSVQVVFGPEYVYVKDLVDVEFQRRDLGIGKHCKQDLVADCRGHRQSYCRARTSRCSRCSR
jgi:hypothetical protein